MIDGDDEFSIYLFVSVFKFSPTYLLIKLSLCLVNQGFIFK